MLSVATLAPFLQQLLTATADELAEACRFARRRSPVTGAGFLQALVLGYLKDRAAPLEALAQPLGVSRQALDQRFGPAACALCRLALLRAANHVVARRAEVFPLLERFAGVFIDDCTQAPLPGGAEADFPGCGGAEAGQGAAGMKLLVRWELTGGQVHHVGVHAARASDRAALAQAPALPAGCLHLADLGFCDFGRLRAEAERGVHWVSRLPAQARVRLAGGTDRPLAEQLRAWRERGEAEVDAAAEVGNKSAVPGRLVAFACPADVAARRLANLEKEARRRGRPVSERQREMCRWTVLWTSVPAGWLSAEQLWRVYRLRWQIELLFKRLKSEGGLGETGSAKPARVECEWYCKLLGQLVRNWLQLLRGGPLRDVNARQLGRVVRDHVPALARALRGGGGLAEALADIGRDLAKVRPRTARKKRPSAPRLLAALGPAA
jgi:hypothetical protein